MKKPSAGGDEWRPAGMNARPVATSGAGRRRVMCSRRSVLRRGADRGRSARTRDEPAGGNAENPKSRRKKPEMASSSSVATPRV